MVVIMSGQRLTITRKEYEHAILSTKSYTEAAELLGCSKSTIVAKSRQYNIKPYRALIGDKISREELRDKLDEGHSYAQIAKFYDVSEFIIYNKCKQLGISRTIRPTKKTSQKLVEDVPIVEKIIQRNMGFIRLMPTKFTKQNYWY